MCACVLWRGGVYVCVWRGGIRVWWYASVWRAAFGGLSGSWQHLFLAVDERVSFGEHLVLQAHTSYLAAELIHIHNMIIDLEY